MIDVSSYLKYGDEFVRVESATKAPPDKNYIEGSIELTIDDTVILDQKSWDYVDRLWTCIIEMVRKIEAGEPIAETHFPDQPIMLRFERKGEGLHVTCDTGKEVRKAQAPARELLDALKVGAYDFFVTMLRRLPGTGRNDSHEITKLIGMARDLTERERSVLAHLIEHSGLPEKVALQTQLKHLKVLGGEPTLLNLIVSPSAEPIQQYAGPLPFRAFVGEANELLLWTTEGYLSLLEYAWIADKPPTSLPDIVDIRIETEAS